MLRLIFTIVSLFTMVNSKNIKNSVPNCITCKWFIPNINNDYGKCKMFAEKNNQILEKVEFNFAIYNYAKHCRDNKNQCGKDGYFYEKNDLLEDTTIETLDMINKIEELKLYNKELYDYSRFLHNYNI